MRIPALTHALGALWLLCGTGCGEDAAQAAPLRRSAVLRTVNCTTAAQVMTALKTALPGDRIVIQPGAYTGSSAQSGNSNAFFFSDRDGTATDRIIVESADPGNQAILQGTSTASKYVLYLKGDYWDVRNLKLRTAKKGIMMDGVQGSVVSGCEVSDIGEEGIHLRDGSTGNTIQGCNVHDVGLVSPGFGECVYVGSDVDKWGTYNPACDNNTISGNQLGPNCTAEPIDVKEGSTGTIISGNTFDGTGISGANSANSFIDVKGNGTVISNNTGNQNGNGVIANAFEVHQVVAGWGNGSDFSGNTVNMTAAPPYLLWVQGVCTGTRAHANTRNPAGNLYTGPVTVY